MDWLHVNFFLRVESWEIFCRPIEVHLLLLLILQALFYNFTFFPTVSRLPEVGRRVLVWKAHEALYGAEAYSLLQCVTNVQHRQVWVFISFQCLLSMVFAIFTADCLSIRLWMVRWAGLVYNVPSFFWSFEVISSKLWAIVRHDGMQYSGGGGGGQILPLFLIIIFCVIVGIV